MDWETIGSLFGKFVSLIISKKVCVSSNLMNHYYMDSEANMENDISNK